MAKRTVLCVCDDGREGVTSQRLRQAGFEVCTARPRHAVAIFFVNRRLDAVVIEDSGSKEAACALAALLRSIRKEVAIVLVSSSSPEHLPGGVDACVTPENSLEILARVLADLHAGLLAPREAGSAA